MASFCGVFNCPYCAGREKDKSNYRFPSILKKNGKEGLKLSKVRREKWLVQIFRENLTERTLERTKSKNQNNAFCLPFIVFFTQSLQYQIWEANTYSILTNNNRTWPPVLDSSTKISKFCDPTNSEYKFHKTRIENWLFIGFKLEFPWLGTYSHNHYTMFNLQYDGES